METNNTSPTAPQPDERTALVKWFDGKKTYFTAAAIMAVGIMTAYGIEVPEYVWAALAALGLGFLRMGVKSAGLKNASKLLMFATLGVALSGSLAACATTEQGKIDQANVLYVGVSDGVNTLFERGAIDAQTYLDLSNTLLTAREALNSAELARVTGDSATVSERLRFARSLLRSIQAAYTLPTETPQSQEQNDADSNGLDAGRSGDQRSGDGDRSHRNSTGLVSPAARVTQRAIGCGVDADDAQSHPGTLDAGAREKELASLTSRALTNLVGVGVTPSFSGVGAAAPESFTLSQVSKAGARHARRSEPGILHDGAAGQVRAWPAQLYQTFSSSSTRAA